MAKGPEITDEVRMLAADLHKKHPKWTSKEIRNWVLDVVHKSDPSLPEGWPSKFAIDRIMPGIRERAKRSRLEPNPLDKPWTFRTMREPEHYISPEALPAVLRVWYLLQNSFHISLTIRQAQWAARLYATVTNTENLAFWAQLMAIMDEKAEDAGIVDYMGSEIDNLHLLSTMTGHAMTREEYIRISGLSDEEWRELRAEFSEVKIKLDMPENVEVLSSGIHYGWPTAFDDVESSQKEAQNER